MGRSSLVQASISASVVMRDPTADLVVFLRKRAEALPAASLLVIGNSRRQREGEGGCPVLTYA